MDQSYDIQKSYDENYAAGPQLNGLTVDVPLSPLKPFLGREVHSRIGVAAGLLLNSRWIDAYADLGYDLLTYKTVRSSYRPCYPLPNWVFVSDDGQLDGPIYVRDQIPSDLAKVSSAVCFGMPSMSPDVWRSDVTVAKDSLNPGQLLIVSVVATPEEGWGAEEIAADFARCAAWAVDAGADVIEANLSCPNVCTAEGSIYLDPSFSRQVAEKIRAQINKMPLILKIGYFDEASRFDLFLRTVAPVVDGVTMVNGITRPVLHKDGRPAFGDSFVRAGVLGRSIHRASLDSVVQARRTVDEADLNLAILAVGGASLVEDIETFFKAGANAVMLGSSPMYHPRLAAESKAHCPDW
jgi:dihydroorotate dehydrogenase (NAD+) catalytic subunit